MKTTAGDGSMGRWAGIGEDVQGLHIGDYVLNLLYAEESLAPLSRPPAYD